MARKRRDALHAKLDQLAEKIASDALAADSGITHAQRVSTLKVVGAYWALSNKTVPDKDDDNAWRQYSSQILGNGKDQHGAEDEP